MKIVRTTIDNKLVIRCGRCKWEFNHNPNFLIVKCPNCNNSIGFDVLKIEYTNRIRNG